MGDKLSFEKNQNIPLCMRSAQFEGNYRKVSEVSPTSFYEKKSMGNFEFKGPKKSLLGKKSKKFKSNE